MLLQSILHSKYICASKLEDLNKIKVGAVSYLNTKPLLYGLQHHSIIDEIELFQDYPSGVAKLLLDNEIDVGLVPVAVIPQLAEWHIVGEHCIGCDGAVASVCLFSEEPLENITQVYLDYQSKTSVQLARILLKEYWKKDVAFVNASGEDFRNKIQGQSGGVVIGDRALEQRNRSKYVYDLGEAWKNFTGLPFVFAAWVANKKLSPTFEARFSEANELGLQQLDEVILQHASEYFDLSDYYRKYISYHLDENKLKGLDLFLKKLSDAMPHAHPQLG